MGFLSAHTPTLQKAELLDISDRDLISTISLPDLQIIMNLLPNQAHKIHYLQKRKVVEESFTYFGDELDLLGLYLKTSFNLPENSETNWIISDLASSVYKFYGTGRFLNDRDEKPSINTTQYFMDIINSLQDRSTPGWSVLTSFLLNIPHGDQKEIEKGILSLREENLKNHQFIYANYRYRLLGTEYILMIYFHDLSDKDERDELMYQVMNQLKEEKGILEFAAIGFNKSNERYPYNLAGYFSYNP